MTLFSPPAQVAQLCQLELIPDLAPRYNIAPTQAVSAVRLDSDRAGRELVPLRWGLVPSWAQDLSIGSRMLNARSETVSAKPAFRAAFARRRCLIPVDGFYEWQTVGGRKLPLHFCQRSREPFTLAGLWEHWTSPDGRVVQTCTVLTTQANEVVAPVHDRMPVVLAPADHALWLDPSVTGGDMLQGLLRPWPAADLEAVAASPLVNSPRNEGPGCLRVAPELFTDLAG
jgi:putative SOS response-associated peptidase YedK